MFKDVSNSPQNFTFMGTMVFEIAGGFSRSSTHLVKELGTKGLGKGRAEERTITQWGTLGKSDGMGPDSLQAPFVEIFDTH